MTAIRASLERDYGLITEQSIPNTKAKQVLPRTHRCPAAFLFVWQVRRCREPCDRVTTRTAANEQIWRYAQPAGCGQERSVVAPLRTCEKRVENTIGQQR